jgi:hypothetical protein
MTTRFSKDNIRTELMKRPGKRGIDIPEDVYDRILPHAMGASMKTRDRHPTPEIMQHLHDNGIHQPEQIKAFFDGLKHPKAPNMSVGEYNTYKSALSLYKEHKR